MSVSGVTAEAASRQEKSHSAPPLNILLVEDNPSDARLTELRILSCCSGSANVLQVDSLASALVSLTCTEFDVVLLDLDLPDSNGIETVILVLQQCLTTPVVVLSGHDNEGVALEAIRLGAQDYVKKARTNKENFERIIRHAIERHELRLGLERRISELESKRQNFRNLIADNADAMVVVDQLGTIRFANTAAETILRRSAETLVGEPFGIPLEGSEASEIELIARDGKPFVVDMRVMATRWDGELAYIATLRDVTQHKEAENLLKVARQSADMAGRIKGQFLANVSHELRTPINAIVGFADLLPLQRNGKLGHERYATYLRDIRGAATDLSGLIDRLLDLSKARAGAIELHETLGTLDHLLSRVSATFEAEAEAAGLDLILENSAPEIALKCDFDRIEQILGLLVSNSVKFTPSGGKVALSVRLLSSGALRIEVTDTGIGMPEDQKIRAFSAFDRPEQPYSAQHGQGAGLGLALAKSLTELHEGTIRLVSNKDAGTQVQIEFPAHRVIRDLCERLGPISA